MKTFENLYTEYVRITKDDSTQNIDDGKIRINDAQKNICNLADFTFLDDEMYGVSVANQQSYRLPHNYQQGSLSTVYILVDGEKYFPTEIHSQEEFERIASDTSTSSYPTHYCVYADKVSFYPLPPDTSWTIYLKYRQVPIEMTADDYSTGTITATLNSRNLVGNGTTFTSDMVGRMVKLPDGIWYKIQVFGSTTELLLDKTYEGATTVGASYIIGDCTIIPDGFQDLCVYPALENFFMMTGEETRSTFYKNLYDLGISNLKKRYLSRSANQVFRKTEYETRNPNDYPTGLH